MRKGVLGEQALCHKGPPNRYRAGRSFSFTISPAEKRMKFRNAFEGKKIPASLFGFVHLWVFFCIYYLSRQFSSNAGRVISEKVDGCRFLATALQLEQNKGKDEGSQTIASWQLLFRPPKMSLWGDVTALLSLLATSWEPLREQVIWPLDGPFVLATRPTTQ